jgi:hypothetical protein
VEYHRLKVVFGVVFIPATEKAVGFPVFSRNEKTAVKIDSLPVY